MLERMGISIQVIMREEILTIFQFLVAWGLCDRLVDINKTGTENVLPGIFMLEEVLVKFVGRILSLQT